MNEDFVLAGVKMPAQQLWILVEHGGVWKGFTELT